MSKCETCNRTVEQAGRKQCWPCWAAQVDRDRRIRRDMKRAERTLRGIGEAFETLAGKGR